MRHALIHKDAGSDYGVSFPDFPGCATAGGDLDEAPAEEALAFHVGGLIEDGEALPEPSSLEGLTRSTATAWRSWWRWRAIRRRPCGSPCRRMLCARSTPMPRRRGSRGQGLAARRVLAGAG